jgi:hypothetical protein
MEVDMTSEQATPFGESGDAAAPSAVSDFGQATANDGNSAALASEGMEHILRTRLPEELNAALESPDPVAGLDNAMQTIADELSRQSVHDVDSEGPIDPTEEMADAIGNLVRVALEMDDPVSALEEGADSLAEALAGRDLAEQARQRAAEEKWVDRQAAYQHARLHRVGELVDAGYSLDQAVAITNGNEADIRAMSAETGRDPMDAIYRYAVLNGYRRPQSGDAGLRHDFQPEGRDGSFRNLAALAQLSDEAFAEATKGKRWQALMQPGR